MLPKLGVCVAVLAVALHLFAAAGSFTAKVVGIADGDTITVLYQRNAIRIRLAGVDAPERRQAWGTRARQFTAAACFNKIVTVIGREQDRYGRLVGEVLLPDGQSLGEALVRNGLAWQYRRYSSSSRLADLEQQARKERIRLWSDSNPVPPWEFRQRERHRKPVGAGLIP